MIRVTRLAMVALTMFGIFANFHWTGGSFTKSNMLKHLCYSLKGVCTLESNTTIMHLFLDALMK